MVIHLVSDPYSVPVFWAMAFLFILSSSSMCFESQSVTCKCTLSLNLCVSSFTALLYLCPRKIGLGPIDGGGVQKEDAQSRINPGAQTHEDTLESHVCLNAGPLLALPYLSLHFVSQMSSLTAI